MVKTLPAQQRKTSCFMKTTTQMQTGFRNTQRTNKLLLYCADIYAMQHAFKRNFVLACWKIIKDNYPTAAIRQQP